MKLEDRTLRIGAVAIIGALLLRLLSGGIWDQAVAVLSRPEVAAFLLYLETGRVIRPVEPQTPTQPQETVIPKETVNVEPPSQPEQDESAVAVFSQADALLVQVNSACGYTADAQALLQTPLSWDLTADAPTVLILHSHATESYTKTENYTESSDYRTLDTQYNMVSIGERLAQLLEAGGIRVLHDATLHDYPSYSDSYNQSRMTVADYLDKYPSIRLVLDLHRDSVTAGDGRQLSYTVQTGAGKAAQLMLVVGTDASGLNHPNWLENMALAVKLHALLEKNHPGICRPISFRSQRFNQDLSTGALLIEVGAAGNTRQEALLSAELLAQTVLSLSGGAVTADPTS